MARKYHSLAELDATRTLDANRVLFTELLEYREKEARPSEMGLIEKQLAECRDAGADAEETIMREQAKMAPEEHADYLPPGATVMLSYAHENFSGARAEVVETRVHDGEAMYMITISTSVMRFELGSVKLPDGTWENVDR